MNNAPFDEYELACEFAKELNDQKSISWHVYLVRTYDLRSLREQLKEALAVPDDQVLVNRAAIYNSRVRRYGIRKNTRN